MNSSPVPQAPWGISQPNTPGPHVALPDPGADLAAAKTRKQVDRIHSIGEASAVIGGDAADTGDIDFSIEASSNPIHTPPDGRASSAVPFPDLFQSSPASTVPSAEDSRLAAMRAQPGPPASLTAQESGSWNTKRPRHQTTRLPLLQKDLLPLHQAPRRNEAPSILPTAIPGSGQQPAPLRTSDELLRPEDQAADAESPPPPPPPKRAHGSKTRAVRGGPNRLLWTHRLGGAQVTMGRPPRRQLSQRSMVSLIVGFCCGVRFVIVIALALLFWLGIQLFMLNQLLPTLNMPDPQNVPPLPNGLMKVIQIPPRSKAMDGEAVSRKMGVRVSHDGDNDAAVSEIVELQPAANKTRAAPHRMGAVHLRRRRNDPDTKEESDGPDESTTGMSVLEAQQPVVLPLEEVEAEEMVPNSWFFDKSRLSALFTPDERFALVWSFLLEQKQNLYVGNEGLLARYFPQVVLPLTRYSNAPEIVPSPSNSDTDDISPKFPFHYYNTLAVFPGAKEGRLHGLLGFNSTGAETYKPSPRPPTAEDAPGGVEAALKDGGFYRALSDSISLNRQPLDPRQTACKRNYDLLALEDVSIIMVFFNEAPSTLLRSLHSILNQTPPMLLREIILVDDHSTVEFSRPGGFLEQYISLLPKVKLMRLPERRGIVPARLSGIGMAQAPVVVILDSHIEVAPGWLEPQLDRLRESPKSIVFPLILSLDPKTFDFTTAGGVGCFLSFHWKMTERPYFQGVEGTTEIVPSASMAGGLFAVRKEWFDEIGGYDTGMSIWGSENVEMGFRTWQCGGRLECVPCSIVFHVFREKGTGYTTPENSGLINVLRTGRIWTEEYYQLVAKFNGRSSSHDPLIGNIDRMLLLKQRLNCKSFKWYLENVDPNKKPRNMEDIVSLGPLVNKGYPSLCLDCMGHRTAPDQFDVYPCHFLGGTQGFLMLRNDSRIYPVNDETTCLSKALSFTECTDPDSDNHWNINFETGQVAWRDNETDQCLSVLPEETINQAPASALKIELQPCAGPTDVDHPQWKGQFWNISRFELDANFALPSLSPAAIARQARLEKWHAESP